LFLLPFFFFISFIFVLIVSSRRHGMQTANEADKVLLGKQPHQALNNLSYGNYHAENFRKKIAV